MSDKNDLIKGISIYAARNRLSSRLESPLVSCDCPLIHSFIDKPTFQHQCAANLALVSTRWSQEDWISHFEQEHGEIVDELLCLCNMIASDTCPFGCLSKADELAAPHGNVPSLEMKNDSEVNQSLPSLADTVLGTLQHDREFELGQKKRDPIAGGLRIEHDEKHRTEKAKAAMFLHLSSHHLPELQFIRSLAQELSDPLRSSRCPFNKPAREEGVDLEAEDKVPIQCDSKHVDAVGLLRVHHQQFVVAAKYVRRQLEADFKTGGHIATCSITNCLERITSLEWGMQHYARLHSSEIPSMNLKMVKRQMEEADLVTIPCPFPSSTRSGHCSAAVKKNHRLYPHLDSTHSKEMKELAVALAPTGGSRRKKIILDLLKIASPDEQDRSEPEIEHICVLCSVLKEQNHNLPIISSTLERIYHDSVPELVEHIVHDHKDLLLALSSFCSNIIGDPSRLFTSCPLHPCTAGGGGEGFRAVFGGQAEVHSHNASRHIDHLVSIVRVALLLVQTSLLKPLLKCPFPCSSDSTSSFDGGMDLLLHMMQSHGEELLKHSNHSSSSKGVRPKAIEHQSAPIDSNPVKEVYGLVQDADVDLSFTFTSSDKDQRKLKTTSKDQVAVTAALIATKLSTQQKPKSGDDCDFGLKTEVEEDISD